MTTQPLQGAANTPAAEKVEQQFRRLSAAWEADTRVLSNPSRIVNHWAFREMIGLGQAVIPLMLRDLERGPHLWVWALPEITGENPVAPGDEGDIRRMTETWLRWGRAKGYQW